MDCLLSMIVKVEGGNEVGWNRNNLKVDRRKEIKFSLMYQ